MNFLDWLAGGGLTLATCTQPDLDSWAAGEISYRDETGHFIRWAVAHRHTAGLTFGTIRWEGPRCPHDGEKRWDDARRLLQDRTLKTPDRVAGLLLLLYAQNLATISLLTTGHVRAGEDEVSLQLGTAPVVLPEPVLRVPEFDGAVKESAWSQKRIPCGIVNQLRCRPVPVLPELCPSPACGSAGHLTPARQARSGPPRRAPRPRQGRIRRGSAPGACRARLLGSLPQAPIRPAAPSTALLRPYQA